MNVEHPVEHVELGASLVATRNPRRIFESISMFASVRVNAAP
jgi:hypothetical protein